MVHVTIDYMILMPLLIAQIFLFPLMASWTMDVWIDSRRTLAVQDVAGHLGSTIQQLYFLLNHATISAVENVRYALGLPPYIEFYHYLAYATLRTVSGQEGSSRVLDLTVRLVGTRTVLTVTIVLGPNIEWRESTFISNSTNACVSASKFPNGTITVWFGE